MTLDECYAKYQGQTLSFDGVPANAGQCVQWVEYPLTEVYNQSAHWANAIDWWKNPGELLNFFDKITDGSIKKGDIVIFNEKVGSVYGHIDVAMQDGTTDSFQGADSNWGGNKTVHLVQHSGSQYVLGALRPKGESMASTVGKDEVNDLSQMAFGYPASDADYAEQVGKESNDRIRWYFANPSYAAYQAQIVEWERKANLYDQGQTGGNFKKVITAGTDLYAEG